MTEVWKHFGEIVEVVWVDHTFHVGVYNPAKQGLTVRLSSGYLVRDDDEVVVIAQTADADGTYEDCLWFIKGCVVEIRRPSKKGKLA